MNRDKQTDEVITDNEIKSNNFEFKRDKDIEAIDTILRRILGSPFAYTPDYGKYGGFEAYKEFYTKDIAKELNAKGYRKASDVAREIFEGIIELAKHSADEAKMRADKETNVLLRAQLRGQQIGANLMLYKLAELKKKYTESEKDDAT